MENEVLLPDGGSFKAGKNQNLLMKSLHTVGDGLYALGFAGEYRAVQVCRMVRDAAVFMAQILAIVFVWLGRNIAAVARAVWKDITTPFVRFRKRQAQLARARSRARKRAAKGQADVNTYFGVGMRSSLQLMMNILGVLLPVGAAAVLVFTVYNVMGMEYALAVEINGKVLGYVADQNVVESAKGLLRDRIRLAQNQELGDWQLKPDYTLAKAASYTTTQQLVNNILRTNIGDTSDLVEATGFYVNNELVAVTTEGQRLRAYLDEKLKRYEDPLHPDAMVSFVKNVECEPNDEDVYFSSSVESYDTLLKRLSAVEADEVTYEVQEEQALKDIAHAHGITLEELISRNPQYDGENGDFEPEAGESLVIRRAQPYLQVQLAYREQSVETIPFATTEVENDELLKGVRQVKQEGVDGQQEVWDDYVYIDGELAQRVRVEDLTVVTAEPVEEIIEVGTKVISLAGPGAPGAPIDGLEMPAGGYGGAYIFPVPGSPYSSRGFSPGGHRGLDINAPAGTPIYACEGGTVITAGWHYSFGNYVVIQHPGNVTTLYAHCSALYVSAGQQVGQGAAIAAVGSTGNSSGNHCHLEIAVNGGLVNPVGYVGYPY